MAAVFEAFGEFGFGLYGAAFELVGCAAGYALEVMVVGLAGDFVARGCAGDLHGGEPMTLKQRGDVAVDGGDADAVHLLLREQESLSGALRLVISEAPGRYMS